jgi:hypothetical protein
LYLTTLGTNQASHHTKPWNLREEEAALGIGRCILKLKMLAVLGGPLVPFRFGEPKPWSSFKP